ncbi:MAG: UDP-N-acetylmuramoyl-tripeptide--D-alanyl-D-alanine ligase [Polyangiales bacterium]
MSTPIPTNEAAFTAAEIAVATGGSLIAGGPEIKAIGVTTDSRAVVPGNAFVALRGEAFDGHRYVGGAVDRGARVVVIARGEAAPLGVAVVVVDDTLAALGALSRAHRQRSRAGGARVQVAAITGSAGKTTTKELVAALAIGTVGPSAVHATIGNLNNRIGVPMTLLGLRPEHQVAVVECGTSLRGEIAVLAEIAQPSIALLTHVGVAHAEGLMSSGESPHQAVAREKAALLRAARRAAVACGDDPWATASLLEATCPFRRTYGRSERDHVRVLDVEAHDDTQIVTLGFGHLWHDEQQIKLELPLLGDVAAINLAGAFTVVAELFGWSFTRREKDGTDVATLNAALRAHVRPVAGRLCPRARGDGALVLDDTYNASPSAFASSIATARAIADRAQRRLVIVAGEMRELGAIAVAAHDEVGAALADARPDWLITTGALADRYATIATSREIKLNRCDSPVDAARVVAAAIGPRDLVLVKASRGVALERVVDAILAHGLQRGEVGSALMETVRTSSSGSRSNADKGQG